MRFILGILFSLLCLGIPAGVPAASIDHTLAEIAPGIPHTYPFSFRIPDKYLSFYSRNNSFYLIMHAEDFRALEKDGGLPNLLGCRHPFFKMEWLAGGELELAPPAGAESVSEKSGESQGIAWKMGVYRVKIPASMPYLHTLLLTGTKGRRLRVQYYDRVKEGEPWSELLSGLEDRTMANVQLSLFTPLKPEFGDEPQFSGDETGFRHQSLCRLDRLRSEMEWQSFEKACPPRRFLQLSFPESQSVRLGNGEDYSFDRLVWLTEFQSEGVAGEAGRVRYNGKTEQVFLFSDGKMIFSGENRTSPQAGNWRQPLIIPPEEVDRLLRIYAGFRSEKFQLYQRLGDR